MTTKKPRDLHRQEPIEVSIPIGTILVWSFIFALVFFIIGSVFKYYPVIGA